MSEFSKSDLQKKKESSAAVSFNRFTLLTEKFPSDLYCFYEGKDAPYYFQRIVSVCGTNNHAIVCGNKKSVLYLFKRTSKKELNKYRRAFFVDRDFDDSIHNPVDLPIYETPCYSIENLYTSEQVLKNILKSEFNLSEIDPEFIELLEIFKARQTEFHEAVLLFNAWYASLKALVKKGDYKSTQVSLDNKLPRGFVSISLDKVSKEYDLDHIQSDFPEAIELDLSLLEEQMQFFSEPENVKYFRGKYEVEFFAKFLDEIIVDAIKTPKTERLYIKNGSSFRLDKSQFLTQLSGYAETPGCLIEYLKSFLQQE